MAKTAVFRWISLSGSIISAFLVHFSHYYSNFYYNTGYICVKIPNLYNYITDTTWACIYMVVCLNLLPIPPINTCTNLDSNFIDSCNWGNHSWVKTIAFSLCSVWKSSKAGSKHWLCMYLIQIHTNSSRTPCLPWISPPIFCAHIKNWWYIHWNRHLVFVQSLHRNSLAYFQIPVE